MVVTSDNFFQQCIAQRAGRRVGKDSAILIYVREESRIFIAFQYLPLKSVAGISLSATFWRFLGEFLEYSV